VFVDVDAHGLIDLDLCRGVFDAGGVRGFVPVHLYGQLLDLDTLRDLNAHYELSIVEDCAQSVGAKWRGRSTGSIGQLAATSFYPTKNLGALGDGGALLTDSETLASKARNLRNYGQSAQYVHDTLGLNSRLDEMQAAILRDAMLPRLAEWTGRRRATAVRYRSGIEHKSISLPKTAEGSESAWHLFPVLVDPSKRDAFLAHLRAKGIGAGIHYPALIPDQKAMKEYGRFEVRGTLSQARRFAGGEVSLPIHPFLRDDEVTHVIEACNGWRDA
jgi:dTDP-3-amino-3,4,6-trideoxy-alpha-D-glucose transaminase